MIENPESFILSLECQITLVHKDFGIMRPDQGEGDIFKDPKHTLVAL